MSKLLWRFSLLLALALGFAWLADRPGRVTIQWLGRDIEMSVVVAVALLLAALIGLSFVWQFLRRIWRSPTAAREFWRFRRHRKAYDSLSKGMIAAGAGDAQAASKHAAIAANTLSDEPLVNVLVAQAAQLKGDRDSVRRVFETMAKSPDTEVFGLRGLFVEARQSGDLVAALSHAEKALSLNPRLPWASSAVLQVQTARKLYLPAAKTLDQQGRSGLLNKAEAARKRAAMLTAEALDIEDTDRAQALALASEAMDLDPALVPAILVTARCHLANDSQRKAAKVLRKGWDTTRHPDIARVLARSGQSEGPEARFERIRDFVGAASEHIESAIALAQAALAAKRYDVAHAALENYAHNDPPARVCALLGNICEAEGDQGRAREWLARAIHAPRDPMWVSDGVASPKWRAVSPVTGEIVPCEWKVPFDLPPAPMLEPSNFGSEAGPVLIPAMAQKSEPPTATQPFTRPPDDPGIADDDRTA